jgi:hypothetical protein
MNLSGLVLFSLERDLSNIDMVKANFFQKDEYSSLLCILVLDHPLSLWNRLSNIVLDLIFIYLIFLKMNCYLS